MTSEKMNLKSKLFDTIRIKSRSPVREEQTVKPPCAWPGCDQPGQHRAPKGARAEGQFHHFCLEHIRKYNQSFNYFEGMDDSEVAESLRRNAQTGDRPTWKMGTNGAAGSGARANSARPRDFTAKRINDPFNVFARFKRAQARNPIKEKERSLLAADRHALEMLGLDKHSDSKTIKSAYKTMVKRHHPDANGGDKASEERLRNVIQAFNHLKAKGFV